MSREHIHFVTGRLAEFALRKVLEPLAQQVGFAAPARRPATAARTRVRRGDQRAARRIARDPVLPHDRDLPVLERLAQRFERAPVELGQLIQEEHTTVSERRLAR